MTVAVSMFETAENRIRKVLKNGTGYFRSRFINDENSGQPEGPTCYLIEQDPNTVIGAHFHQANQFQVMVAGGGTLGKRDIGPIVVHYTDAYTTYGPINAHDEGLHYFTLRDGFDPGARFMPEQRAELIRKRGRHIVSNALTDDFAPETNEVEVIAPEDDGLEARLIRIRGGETVTGLDPAGGGGQFWLVISGNVIHERRWIESYGCIHVAGDDRSLTLTGADGGAEVIMMQFPRPPH